MLRIHRQAQSLRSAARSAAQPRTLSAPAHTCTLSRSLSLPRPTGVNNNHSRALSTASTSAGSLSLLEAAKLQVRLSALEQQIQSGAQETHLLEEYVRILSTLRPREALSALERGWENQKLPVSESLLREYLKAAASAQKLDSLNIAGLLALVQKAAQRNGGTETAALSAAALSAEAHKFSSLLSRSAGATGQQPYAAFAAGASPLQPLYVASMAEKGWRTQAWGVLKHAVGLFLLFSLVGTFMDEKGPASGISSRLGLGSAVHQAENSDKTFNDVVGVDEAKADLVEIVHYLRDPKRFTRLGGRLPKGVLLTGPPGTGKTLLARAIAGEAKVPFFHSSGSEFEEMYVGVGAKRVRELFEVAKSKAPCIIFIDEIDAIGGSRSVKDQSAMKMTLNQLLVEMDGFEQNNGVIVIAATNFPDSLDNALVRPGRFDKHVDVSLPDLGGRKAILEYYGKKMPMSAEVDLEQLARGTPGFSGAELFNLVNQAALKASVEGLSAISMAALEFAKDKILMGAERKSAVISPETLRMTAFHEAGHALVALKTTGADPIHKATIMPRGRALGMVMQLPEGDQTSMSLQQMRARLDVCMGGRVAEELVYGVDLVTSGASSDIQQATRLARAMVTKWGLSEKVGVVFFDDNKSPSGQTAQQIDDEVKELLTASYNRAKALLTKHRRELNIIAEGLVEYESLSGSEVVELVKNGKLENVKKRSQKPSREIASIPKLSESKVASKEEVKENKGAAVSAPAPAPAPTANTNANTSSAKSSGVSSSPVVPEKDKDAPKPAASSRGPPKM